MLGTLIRKELMAHVLSVRFHLTAALVVLLLGGAAVLHRADAHRRFADYTSAEQTRQQELAEAAERPSPLFQVFSYSFQPLMSRPSGLSFVADGHERELPNVVQVQLFRLDGPKRQQRSNPMLPPHEALDWSLIVGVVLSFAAIVLTFDAFAGEREDGTLRLLLANPVPRWQLVAAKFTGAWGILMAGLVVGVLVQLLVLLPGGVLVLDGGTMGRLALALVMAALYVAFFVLLGLAVSALNAAPDSALVVSLLVWALLVVVVPRGSAVLAHGLAPVESRDAVTQRAWARVEEAQREYLRLHPKEANRWFSGAWSPGESLDGAAVMWAAYRRELDAWRASWLRQVGTARALALVSPASVLSLGLERVCGTGLERYGSFLAAAHRYRGAMEERVRAIYPLDPVDAAGTDPEANRLLAELPVSVSDLPVFEDRPVPLGRAAVRALPLVFALALLDLLLMAAAVLAAVRYDVR